MILNEQVIGFFILNLDLTPGHFVVQANAVPGNLKHTDLRRQGLPEGNAEIITDLTVVWQEQLLQDPFLLIFSQFPDLPGLMPVFGLLSNNW